MYKSINLNIMLAVFAISIAAACGALDSIRSGTSTPPISPVGTGGSQTITCSAQVVEQSYEHGFMFWIGKTAPEKWAEQHSFEIGSGKIWVAYANSIVTYGKWQVFVDDWSVGTDPERDLSLTAPAGLVQPIRGFGKVWTEKLAESDRKLLGWATGDEFLIQTDYRYEGEVLINSQGQEIDRPGKHTLVGLAGDTFLFDEVSQTAAYTPAPSP